jgi:hypothetical protein
MTQIDNLGVTEFQYFAMLGMIFPVIFGHELSKLSVFGITNISGLLIYIAAIL